MTRPAARLLILLACAALLLAACAAPALPAPAATASPAPAQTRPPTALPESQNCLVVSVPPTPGPTQPSLFPPPAAQDRSLGPESAEITFLEYTDFQVPASAALDLVLDQLARKYPNNVRRVFRHFPLPNSDKSLRAAAAAEAAAQQGKFWEMAHLLIEQQADWSALAPEAFDGWLAQAAAQLGLDGARFAAGLSDAQIKAKLLADQQFGLTNAIPTMPFLLVNGRIYQGPRDLRSLESLVGLARLEARQFTDCPPFVIDPQKQYVAELHTARGTVVLNLFAKQAPFAVNNFVFLARQGWYDGVIFHRVLAGQLVQAGDPSGSGYGSPGYAFADEITSLGFDRPGVLAMANAGPNSNGSQFFITLRAMPELTGTATIFGSVLDGMEVLEALAPRDPSLPVALPDGEVIEKVVIREQ